MPFDLQEYRLRFAFRSKVRARVWRGLARQTKNQIPVYDAIRKLEERAKEKKQAVAQVYTRILRGRDIGLPLAYGIRGLATSGECMLLESAEQSGDLSSGFQLAFELVSARARLFDALRSGLTYPCFLLFLAILVLCIIAKMIVPQLSMVLKPEEWTGAAKSLYNLSAFVNSQAGLFSFLLLLIGLSLSITTLPTWTGRLRQKVDGFAIWGVYRCIEGASWLFCLATLMSARVNIRIILTTMLSSSATSPYLKERIESILKEYSAGHSIGHALDHAGYDFPSQESIEQMIAWGELPEAESRMLELAREELLLCIERLQAKTKALAIALVFFVFSLALLTISAVFSFQQQFQASV